MYLICLSVFLLLCNDLEWAETRLDQFVNQVQYHSAEKALVPIVLKNYTSFVYHFCLQQKYVICGSLAGRVVVGVDRGDLLECLWGNKLNFRVDLACFVDFIQLVVLYLTTNVDATKFQSYLIQFGDVLLFFLLLNEVVLLWVALDVKHYLRHFLAYRLAQVFFAFWVQISVQLICLLEHSHVVFDGAFDTLNWFFAVFIWDHR